MKNNETIIKRFYFIIGLFGFLTLNSCNDFLDKHLPESFISKENFYKNEEQFNQALNGIYGQLQNFYSTNSNFWRIAEERSDNTTFQFNPQDRGTSELERADMFELYPANPLVEEIWRNSYNSISQCNQLIDAFDLAGENFNASIQGQVKFIRSLYYFNLVRLYGNIPLVSKGINSPIEAFDVNTRSSIETIYDFIVQDISDAISVLPDVWEGNDRGRITKGAANALLGLVHLTRKNYEKANDYFENIISSKLYELIDDYQLLFDPSNKYNSESVFEIGFNSGIEGEHSNFIYRFAPFNSRTDIVGFNDLSSGGAGFNIPTRDMIRAYEDNDSRFEASVAWYINSENIEYPDVAFGDSIPYIKKFATPPTEPGRQDNNIYVIRYSQVLLWQAEALNEIGADAQRILRNINLVRERAGLEPIVQLNLSKSELNEIIGHEERVESAFENDRWFQLLRSGKAVEVMNKHGEEMKLTQYWLGPDSYNVLDHKLLLPIPERDRELLNLDQNPGW